MYTSTVKLVVVTDKQKAEAHVHMQGHTDTLATITQQRCSRLGLVLSQKLFHTSNEISTSLLT